jgi:hypothetical protein
VSAAPLRGGVPALLRRESAGPGGRVLHVEVPVVPRAGDPLAQAVTAPLW